MIISASRRTDIPCLYADWFMARVQDGFVRTRNPFNAAQQKTVSLAPGGVEGIVFWSKDPQPLIPHLDTLEGLGYAFYFQFTLTPYGQDIEKRLRPLPARIETLQSLGDRLGKERVLWRYDPILYAPGIDGAFHLRAFEELAAALYPYAGGVTISFLDLYRGRNMAPAAPVPLEEQVPLAAEIARLAASFGLPLWACCESGLHTVPGIQGAACMDARRLSAISGAPIRAARDPGQRPGCGCHKSVDIGAYGTCHNGCVYCYARRGKPSILN